MATFEPIITNHVTVGELIEALQQLPANTPLVHEDGRSQWKFLKWDQLIYGGGNLFVYAPSNAPIPLLGEPILEAINKP